MDTAQPNSIPPVAVLFRERIVTMLFADLVAVHGSAVQVIKDISELRPGRKLITEVQYYEQLDEPQRASCLVVGSSEQLRRVTAPSLSQPLTEEKVERALENFLSPLSTQFDSSVETG